MRMLKDTAATGAGNPYALVSPACCPVPDQCSVDGCERTVECKSLCAMHAQRFRRYGDPLFVTPEATRRANNREAQLARFEPEQIKETTYRKRHGRHEHRVVAEQMLGRPLMEREIVHHIDGNRHNNHPSNLKVMTQSQHLREHLMPEAKPIEWNGQTLYPKEWAAELGMSVQRFYGRRRAGWSMDRIASTPVRQWVRRDG